jgi:putative ABC transport system permease protein
LVSLAGGPPAENGWSSDEFKYNDGKKELVTEVNMKNGDSNYLKLYQIKILAGRNIRASDTTNEYVINETYMHILGFQKPDDVLNKRVNNMPIIGVMSDFNQESLHSPIKPMVYSSEMGNSWELHIALKQNDAEGNSWKATIAAIGKAYKKIFPESDFSYEFLDESIAKFYQAEQHVSGLLKWAAGLAIFISCMGLLGLVMFTTNQRTKEIGVRKVLGASVGQIVSILSKDFLRLVFIASVVATPLAWWAMKKWLDDFAFKTTVNWWVFVVSIAGMILIALFTLSIQTIRAASANPVESLRAE